MIRRSLALVCLLHVFCFGFGGPSDPDSRDSNRFLKEISRVNQSLKNDEIIAALERLSSLWEIQDQYDPVSKEMESLHFFTGKVFLQSYAYSLAATFLKKAFEISSQLQGRQNYHKCGAIGSAYLQAKDWENARKWYQKGIDVAETQPERNNFSTAFNNMGYLFLQQERPDSAIFYFEKALEAWDTYPYDSLFRGSIRDNLAQGLRLQGKSDEALKWYRKNQTTYQDMRKPHSLAQALLGEAEIHFENNNLKPVPVLLNQAKTVIDHTALERREPLLRSWFLLSIRQAKSLGLDRKVRSLQKEYLAFLDHTLEKHRMANDMLTDFFSNLQERSFKKEIELQQLKLKEKENAARQANRDKKRAQMLAILIVAFLAILGFMVFRTLRLRSKYLQRQVHLNEVENDLLNSRLQTEALENENLALKVSLKEQDLTNFALDAAQKTDMLQKIEEELASLKPGKMLHQQVMGIVRDMKAGLQSEAGNRLVRENIAEINAEFRANLLRQFPDLSENEVELCGMIRTGMKTKEIASLRKVTENAVKVARKRLRKKLAIDLKVDLRKFLLGI